MSEQGTSQDQPLDVGSNAENSHLKSSLLRRVQPEEKFTIAGQDYVKASVLGGTKWGKTTSRIWNYGIQVGRTSTYGAKKKEQVGQAHMGQRKGS